MELDRRVSEALHLLPGHSSGGSGGNRGGSNVTKEPSVFGIINQTRTSMGSRKLQSWLCHPLTKLNRITKRQTAVKTLLQHPQVLSTVRDQSSHLKKMVDLDATVQRLSVRQGKDDTKEQTARSSSYSLRDMVQVYRAVAQASAVMAALEAILPAEAQQSTLHDNDDVVDLTDSLSSAPLPSPLPLPVEEADEHPDELAAAVATLRSSLSQLERLRALVEHIFDISSLPNLKTFRGVLSIRAECSPGLLTLHRDMSQAKVELLRTFESLLKQAGLQPKDVKLEQNEVQGWHCRVTKTVANKVFKLLEAKKITSRVLSLQKAGSLFIPDTMQSVVSRLQTLEARYEEAQSEVVTQALQVVLTFAPALATLSDTLAVVDALCALAHVALTKDWTAPQFVDSDIGGGRIRILGLRHVILEDQLGAMAVVPNDAVIEFPQRLAMVMGPNMGGKSTYLRSIGIAVVLAHMGAFVPAQSMALTLMDRVFIRCGASDSPHLHQSTFMTEMVEISDIIAQATPQSLVLLDEVGRGTSTNDGFGLAYALLTHLALETKCVSLCATHFHDLAVLCSDQQGAFAAYHVSAVVQAGRRDDVTMLYKVCPGESSDSLGIAVARMAGFPEEIVAEALELETTWQSQEELVEIIGQKRPVSAS